MTDRYGYRCRYKQVSVMFQVFTNSLHEPEAHTCHKHFCFQVRGRGRNFWRLQTRWGTRYTTWWTL